MAAAGEYARHLRHVVTENPVTGAAFGLFVLLVLTAVLGPVLAPYDPCRATPPIRWRRRRRATGSAPTSSAATSSAGWWWRPGST